MHKTNRDTISSIYEDMFSANHKAEKASFEYNRLSAEIEKEERAHGKARGLSDIVINEKLRARKEKDNELIGYFKAYSFNQGEVVRLSALLQAIAAYESLKRYSPLARGPVINVDGTARQA